MATTHPSAIRNWRRRRAETLADAWRPKPRLTGTEWAEANRRLSQQNSSHPGRFRMSMTPYFAEVLDAISDPSVEKIVVKKSARVGYTQGVLENAIGYHIDQDPCSILMVLPADDDARGWSKENLTPLIEETPALASKVGEAKWRDPDNTIAVKKYPGGTLRVIGAVSPRGFRRFDCRKVFFDEVDGYIGFAEGEGDQLKLGEKRAENHWDRQFFYGSTPKEKKSSKIDRLFDQSDQRRFFCPCPHCGHRQVLRFGGREEHYGLKWQAVELDGVKVVIPGSVYYLCEKCACAISEREREAMVRSGRWVAQKPGRKMRGYHINALYSLVAPGGWEKIAQDWLDAQGNWEELKVFVNTVLGECWEQPGAAINPKGLEGRAERWVDAAGRRIEVPHGVGLLTAAVDVQDNRLELLVKGWGAREESWDILHERINGRPKEEATWQLLEAFRTRIWRHASGAPLRIAAMCVDSGHWKNETYAYVGPRQDDAVRVYATKGNRPEQAEPYKLSKSKNEQGVRLVLVGTVPMKDTLFARLQAGQREEQRSATEARGGAWAPGDFPEGYIHFRAADPDWHNGADSEYFAQLGRERREKQGGRFVYVAEKDRPVEAIDLQVYNLAALHLLLPKATRLPTLERFAEALSNWTRAPSAASGEASKQSAARRSGVKVISRGRRVE